VRITRHAIFAGLVTLVASTACTTFDGLIAGNKAGVGSSGGVGIGSGDKKPGDKCIGAADCESAICTPDGTCAAASSSDGVKNGSETDVDCGGGTTKCKEGKACREGTDCVWGFCTDNVCEGHKPGRKDGDQTDIDCGGTLSPACDWDKSCLIDKDCTSGACGADKKCLTGPSCKAVSGGSTCGSGELAEPGHQHESCCRSLPVDGFTDDAHPGKTVYLDKYEITAGRMRAFLDSIAAANGGEPNIKGYVEKHRPKKNWDEGWEVILPTANAGGTASYTVSNPTADPLYPGQNDFDARSRPGSNWVVTSGNYTVDTGLFHALGASHYFPEYSSPGGPTPDYAATHNLNCTNAEGSFGFSTYWFDKQTIQTFSGGVGKFFSKEEMDAKALNCTPFALLAAFCAWDGGQLMTTDVFDFVAGGPWPPDPGLGNPIPPTPPRLTGGNTVCANDTLNTFSDSTLSCPNVYFAPDDGGNTHDGSARIAPPGRVPADTVALKEGDEPWMDLKGNLVEAALRPDGLFAHRGYGAGWASLLAHFAQIVTPRMKSGSLGARCMRFK
jgi:hypothetical protein